MTEAEWLACDNPHQMRDHLVRFNPESGTIAGERMGYRTSERKLRLVSAAMLRAVWPGLTAPDSRPAVERLERIAEGLEPPLAGESIRPEDGMGILSHDVFWTLNNASVAALNLGATRPSQASIFRDIVGNPFRPVTLPRGRQRCVLCKGTGWEPSECKVCSAGPDETGEIWHGKGCYMLEEDGGGVELADGCPDCKSRGYTDDAPCPWLTPTVVALARAAYDLRAEQECGRCKGTGWDLRECKVCGNTPDTEGMLQHGRGCYMLSESGGGEELADHCPDCHGSGRIEGGHLDPDRLAVLADALEEAGCDDAVLLAHLRGKERCPNYDREPLIDGHLCSVRLLRHMGLEVCKECDGSGWGPRSGIHVRGCWAIDCVLGLE